MPLGCVAALPCDRSRDVAADKAQAGPIWGGALGAAVMALYERWALERDPAAAVTTGEFLREMEEFGRDPAAGRKMQDAHRGSREHANRQMSLKLTELKREVAELVMGRQRAGLDTLIDRARAES
jgi:hypothetical protein